MSFLLSQQLSFYLLTSNSFNMQVGFSPDDVNSIIKESIDAVLANQQYSEVKVCTVQRREAAGIPSQHRLKLLTAFMPIQQEHGGLDGVKKPSQHVDAAI